MWGQPMLVRSCFNGSRRAELESAGTGSWSMRATGVGGNSAGYLDE
jgi:hypothetical protein